MKKTLACIGGLTGLAAALLLCGCAKKGSQHAVSLLPASADVVLQMNVAAARENPIIKDALQRRKAATEQGPESRKFMMKTGIDPEKDIDLITAGMVFPKSMMGDEMPRTVAVVNGRFSPEKVSQAAADKYRLKEDYEGQIIYHDTKLGAVVVDDSFILWGALSELKKVLDIRNGKAEGVAPDAKVLRGIPPGGPRGAFWLSAGIPAKIFEELGKNPMIAMLLGNLPPIEAVGLTAEIAEPSVLNLYCRPVDEEKTDALLQALEGLLGVGKLMAGSNKGLAETMDSIQVAAEEGRVKITAQVSATALGQQVESGFGKVLKMSGGVRGEAAP